MLSHGIMFYCVLRPPDAFSFIYVRKVHEIDQATKLFFPFDSIILNFAMIIVYETQKSAVHKTLVSCS